VQSSQSTLSVKARDTGILSNLCESEQSNNTAEEGNGGLVVGSSASEDWAGWYGSADSRYHSCGGARRSLRLAVSDLRHRGSGRRRGRSRYDSGGNWGSISGGDWGSIGGWLDVRCGIDAGDLDRGSPDDWPRGWTFSLPGSLWPIGS
jgi:hypothetical protein